MCQETKQHKNSAVLIWKKRKAADSSVGQDIGNWQILPFDYKLAQLFGGYSGNMYHSLKIYKSHPASLPSGLGPASPGQWLSNVSVHHTHLEVYENRELGRGTSRDFDPVGLGWGLRTCTLTSFLVMLKPLARGPHFEDHCKRRRTGHWEKQKGPACFLLWRWKGHAGPDGWGRVEGGQTGADEPVLEMLLNAPLFLLITSLQILVSEHLHLPWTSPCFYEIIFTLSKTCFFFQD